MAEQTNGYTNGHTNGHTNGNTNGHANGHLPAEADASSFASQEFDYVICGGGTAGLVLASRLSENPDVTVGVIEAGGNHLNDPLVDTPAMFLQMFSKDEYDWAFKTTPQARTLLFFIEPTY